MSSTFECRRGVDAGPFTAQLNVETGTPYTGYTGAETITVEVWPGLDLPMLAGVATGAWISGPAGTVAVSVLGTGTTALVPGQYELWIQVDGKDAWAGQLAISPAPGAAQARTARITLDHLRKHYRRIDKLLSGDDFADDRTAFECRADAWDELVKLAHRHYRGASGVSTDFAFVPGISFAGTWGQNWLPRDGRRSAELQAWLDAGRLDLTNDVIDFMALYALAQITRGMVAADDKGGYLGMSRRFEAAANVRAMTLTLEIDSDGDGVNDTTIRLGSADTLES